MKKKSKRYLELECKMKMANKILSSSKEWLPKEHSVYNIVRKSKQKAYSGYRTNGKLYLKGIKKKDYKKLETLFDAIINSAYMDKEKYGKIISKQIDTIKTHGGGDDETSGRILNIINNSIWDRLKELGLDPSEFFSSTSEYLSNGLDDRDVVEMMGDFLNAKDENGSYLQATDFFEYADKYFNEK